MAFKCLERGGFIRLNYLEKETGKQVFYNFTLYINEKSFMKLEKKESMLYVHFYLHKKSVELVSEWKFVSFF